MYGSIDPISFVLAGSQGRPAHDSLPAHGGRGVEAHPRRPEVRRLILELPLPDLPPLGNRPLTYVAPLARQERIGASHEPRLECLPARVLTLQRHPLPAVSMEQLRLLISAHGEPLPLRAESGLESLEPLLRAPRRVRGERATLEDAHGEPTPFLRVGELEAPDGVGERPGGVPPELDLSECEQFSGRRRGASSTVLRYQSRPAIPRTATEATTIAAVADLLQRPFRLARFPISRAKSSSSVESLPSCRPRHVRKSS